MTATVERFGPVPRQSWPPAVVSRVAELAAQRLGDREIAEQLGLTKTQVAGIRSRRQIPAGRPQGRQPRPMSAPPDGPTPTRTRDDTSPNGRWCALLESADRRMWHAMRRAVCQVLRVSAGISDEGLIVAAQRDPRSAEELANAYLLKLGERAS